MIKTAFKIAGYLFLAGVGIVASIYGAEYAMEEFETATAGPAPESGKASTAEAA